jgi:glutamate dehydrogenase/leucine dehydrogenase
MSLHYIDNFADRLGPEKIVHIYEPQSQLRAIVVIDNMALGTAIGGCRMAADVTTREVFRLARAMTMKNAISDLPFGGGKSAILADPKCANKETLVRVFAQSIKHLAEYIPGPDMGTDEECMAWIHAEIGRAIGLPKSMGGLPMDELGATGFGVAVSADIACEQYGLPLKNARVVIQGFGNVGRAAAKFLTQRGARVIGVSDIGGALLNTEGIDIPALIEKTRSGTGVADSGLGMALMSREELLEVESDLFIPAARPDVISNINQHALKTRLIIEAANIPITHEAANALFLRGVHVIPDIIANSGGVICGAMEYQKCSEAQAFRRIQETIIRNTEELIARVKNQQLPPHEIASLMAKERLTEAVAVRNSH